MKRALHLVSEGSQKHESVMTMYSPGPSRPVLYDRAYWKMAD